MSDAVASIDIDSLQSVSQIAADHSVQELLQLNKRINANIQHKRQELRNLVGSKYRDLLKVADDIITMNELVQTQDHKLTKLTFQDSSYTNKSLTNIDKFRSSVSSYKITDLVAANAPKVAKSMLDDLDDFYGQLSKLVQEFDTWNKELNDEEQTFESAELVVDLAVFIYMIDFLFGDAIKGNKILDNRYRLLKMNTITKIQYMLTDLVVDGENELVLNLLNAYIIMTQRTPLQVFEYFLEVRFIKFAKFKLSNYDFQNSLKYLFNTFNYINLFKTNLSNAAIRTIYLNNSSSKNSKSWFKISYISKWRNWIIDYDTLHDIKFPLSPSDLRSLTETKINEILGDWKFKVSDHYASKIDFQAGADLSTQVELISNILIGFKHFTSLVDLKRSTGSSLIDELVSTWRSRFSSTLDLRITEYRDITTKILETHQQASALMNVQSEQQQHSRQKKAPLFAFEDNDLADIDLYLKTISESSSNLIGPNKQLLIQVDEYYKKLESLPATFIELLNLKNKLLKPVLSIDDTDNEPFWSTISTRLEDIYSNLLAKGEHDIVVIEDAFTQELKAMSEKGIDDPTQAADLLRCLTALNNKTKLTEFFRNRQSEVAADTTGQANGQLKAILTEDLHRAGKHYSFLMVQYLRPLLQKLAKNTLDQLRLGISERFDGSVTQIDEVAIWDKSNSDRIIPSQPSYNLMVKLYELSNTVLQDGENKDLLEIDEADELKEELLKGLIAAVIEQLDSKLYAKEELDVSAPIRKPKEVTITNGAEKTASSKSKKKKDKKKKKNGKNGNALPEESSVATEEHEKTQVEAISLDQQEKSLEESTEDPQQEPVVEAQEAGVSKEQRPATEDNESGDDDGNDEEQEDAAEVEAPAMQDDEGTIDGDVKVAKSVIPALDGVENEELFTQKALLTYADLIYLVLFLKKQQFYEEVGTDLSNDSTLVKAKQILKLEQVYGDSDFSKIHKNVFEFFKSNRSLYIF